jgi:hypothetical protein
MQFEERLWAHHTCDWDSGNRNQDYPYQLATAYFDWNIEGTAPEYTVDEAFQRYLESEKER